MSISEAGRFRILQVHPLLCQQRAMCFTQPIEIDEIDSRILKTQGQNDRTS